MQGQAGPTDGVTSGATVSGGLVRWLLFSRLRPAGSQLLIPPRIAEKGNKDKAHTSQPRISTVLGKKQQEGFSSPRLPAGGCHLRRCGLAETNRNSLLGNRTTRISDLAEVGPDVSELTFPYQ